MIEGAEQTCQLLDTLESLLKEQLAAAQTDDLDRLEQLSEKTSTLITEIGNDPLLAQPQFKTRYQQILELSQRLELAVSANADSVAQQIHKVAKGKKTMQAYGHGS
ncbi:MAG: hypothetical protein ACYSUT_00100 [Planctomycetota bacterium]|jgi:hypothetical protein